MKIITEFNIGDTIYFLSDNTIAVSSVTGIETSVDSNLMAHTEYRTDEECSVQNKLVNGFNCYPTTDALIESLARDFEERLGG